MSLLPKYKELLYHLGSSCHIRNLHLRPEEKMIGLRHDVDYDIDIALEMAWIEHSLGFQSTYFLLSDTEYWKHSGFLSKVRQMHDFGHEIGLHLNTLAQWYKCETNSAYEKLQEDLNFLRSSNIEVYGVASHGDKACYEGGFVNHWIFNDISFIPPKLNSISAEGIYVEDKNFQIRTPVHKFIQRKDGRIEHFQQVKLKELGLEYIASNLLWDSYFSDSGGNWIRTPNPIDYELNHSRVQILIHPIHWTDKSKKIFVLSPENSGSKLMCDIFDAATSFKGIHEITLNVKKNNDWTIKKINPSFWRGNPNNHTLLVSRLKQAYAWHNEEIKDSIEFNDCLVDIVDQLKYFFPDGIILGLIRHPYSILRSIIDQGYDVMDTDQIQTQSQRKIRINYVNLQLQHCLDYIIKTYETISRNASIIIRMEDIVFDPTNLADYIKPLPIAYFPRLLSESTYRFSDQVLEFHSPPIHEWSINYKKIIYHRLNPLCRKYGYDFDLKLNKNDNFSSQLNTKNIIDKADITISTGLKYDHGKYLGLQIYDDNHVERSLDDKYTMPTNRHSALFISGLLKESNQFLEPNCSLKWGLCEPKVDFTYNHLAQYEFSCEPLFLQGQYNVFILMFDDIFDLCEKRSIAIINEKNKNITVKFEISAYASYFRLALYSSRSNIQNIIQLPKNKVSLKYRDCLQKSASHLYNLSKPHFPRWQ